MHLIASHFKILCKYHKRLLVIPAKEPQMVETFPDTILLLQVYHCQGIFKDIQIGIKLDKILSNHLSSCNLYQFKNITRKSSQILFSPTRQTTDAMGFKVFHTLFFIKGHNYEGYSNGNKIDRMMCNCLSSQLKYIAVFKIFIH